MEYVEGTDLARLVKQCGPLPVMQACAYVRQAALGLQHAHERGLVHRDIKPHNLILSLREGRIKVADLGLARLPRAANEEVTAALTGRQARQQPDSRRGGDDGDARITWRRSRPSISTRPTSAPTFTAWVVPLVSAHWPAAVRGRIRWRRNCSVTRARNCRPSTSFVPIVPRRPVRRAAPDAGQATRRPLPDARRSGRGDPALHLHMRTLGNWESIRAAGPLVPRFPRPGNCCEYFARRHKVFSSTVLTAYALLDGEFRGHLPGVEGNGTSQPELQASQPSYREERKRTLAAVPAFVEAARLAVDRQRFDNALAQVNVALEYDPENSEARQLKGQVLIVHKEFVRAKEELGRYLKQQPLDREARRLMELCGRKRPDEVGTLLDFAHVFEQQKMPALGDGLLTKYGRSSFEARQWLLKRYQARIDKAWPGLGNRLSVDAAGIYQLDLSGCKQIIHLDALEGMPLTVLSLKACHGVRDLTPLKGMPLRELNLGYNDIVFDLALLRSMPLRVLNFTGCGRFVDLSPLKGMRLTSLYLFECRGIQDLSALKGMPLAELNIKSTSVNDVTPLLDMPLARLWLRSNPPAIKGTERLRSMKSLATINSVPAEEILEELRQGRAEGELKGFPGDVNSWPFCYC